VPQRRSRATRRGGTGMADEELTADELLVEEVSIDGMCGVY
jgi:mycofactocin precursor